MELNDDEANDIVKVGEEIDACANDSGDAGSFQIMDPKNDSFQCSRDEDFRDAVIFCIHERLEKMKDTTKGFYENIVLPLLEPDDDDEDNEE